MADRYVRVHFKSSKRRPIWAKVTSESDKVIVLRRVSIDGTLHSSPGRTSDGAKCENMEVIMGTPDDFHLEPAIMNLHYAELEVSEEKS